MDESRYDEREFSDDPADGYDDELYPTPRRMQQPEVARVERITSPQYATYHQASNIQADISRNDQNRESRKSLPPPSLPPQESPPRPRVINYDTLNDPTSFLYSENAKLEKKSTKQKLVDINFENSQDQDITAQTKVQPVVQPTSGSNQEVGSNSQLQSSMKNEVGDNDVPPSKPTVALENSTSPNTTMPVEPTYSQFDRNRKEGRRRAPPPPTSSK